MNIIQIQNDLKDLSDRQLLDSMNMGSAPQYLVLSEMQRRQKMRSESGAMKAPQSSVAEDVMGGIASMPAPNMQMASGGVVGFAGGGQPSGYAKGAAEACWTNPETGKQDCPPAAPRLMGGKKPKTKTKKTEDSGIKSLYAPGGKVEADDEDILSSLYNYLFDPTERKAATMARLERQQMEGGMTPEQILATQERIAGGDYAGNKGYNLSEMAAYKANKMGDDWEDREELRPNDPEGYAATAPIPVRKPKKEAEKVEAPEPREISDFKEQGIKGAYKDKKGKESNRFADWMLETGLGMLASKNRNFFGALGESGLGAYKNITARDAEAAKEQMLEAGRMSRQEMASDAERYKADIQLEKAQLDYLADEITRLQNQLMITPKDEREEQDAIQLEIQRLQRASKDILERRLRGAPASKATNKKVS